MLNEKFWLAIAFTTFVLLIIKFIWPKIAKALDSSSKKVAEEILAAKELRQKAEKLLEKAEKYHAESLQFAEKLIKDAASEAQKFSEESTEILKKELEKKTAASLARIKMEEDHTIQSLKTKIIDSALSSLNSELGKEIKEDQHEKLNSQALENFSKSLQS